MKTGRILCVVLWTIAAWGTAILPAPAALKPGSPDTRPRIEEGLRLAEQGRYVEAARLFERGAEARPDDATSALRQAGWAWFDAGHYAEAIRVFSALRDRVPGRRDPLDGLCFCYFMTGQGAEVQALLVDRLRKRPASETSAALALVEAGLDAAPGSVAREWALAWLCREMRSMHPGRQTPHLERVLALQPDHKDAHWRLLSRQGDPHAPKTVALREDFLRRYPDTPEACILRSQSVDPPGIEAALKVLDEGLDRFPDSLEIYMRAAHLCEVHPDPQLRAQHLLDLIRRADEHGLVTAARGAAGTLERVLQRQEDFAGAEQVLAQLVSRGSHGTMLRYAGDVVLVQGRWRIAADLYAAAADAEERDGTARSREMAQIRVRQALALLATGDRGSDLVAFGILTKAFPLGRMRGDYRSPELEAFGVWAQRPSASAGPGYEPGDEVPMRVGLRPVVRLAQSTLGTEHKAWVQVLRAVTARYPACFAAHYALARALGRENDCDGALASVLAARSACPSWWAPHWALGEYYRSQGDKEKAFAEYETTYKLAPRHGAALIHWRDLYFGIHHRAAPPRPGMEDARPAAIPQPAGGTP
ncbi:MAG: tetratricopeptide repeat protein [Armatimonadetes bacterium]|nr:tetratricopeptide repeat protein [Armatimonadota bacterium]